MLVPKISPQLSTWRNLIGCVKPKTFQSVFVFILFNCLVVDLSPLIRSSIASDMIT
jgi:hypothetical protein